MTIILEISYLNEVCFLSLNTDDKKYNMVIKIAQDDLSDTLGREFYEQIESEYPTYTGDNLTLYDDYIRDFLAWQTYYYYLKFSQADATPTGIRQFEDENSTVLSDVKLYSFEKNVLSQANRYKYKMVNYLREQQANDATKFPLYTNCHEDLHSFAISSVDKKSDVLIQINQSIINNQ